jgi:hypothetical protein
MSHIAADNKIKFSYSQNTLFDATSLRTTYMTKNMENKKGENIGEEYALSEDEKDAFLICLTTILSEVFEIFLKQTAGVVDAFKTTPVEGGDVTIDISINDHDAYNENVLSLVDTAIYDCIIDGCIKSWFETVVQAELIGISNNQYVLKKEVLKRRLFQLKKMRVLS